MTQWRKPSQDVRPTHAGEHVDAQRNVLCVPVGVPDAGAMMHVCQRGYPAAQCRKRRALPRECVNFTSCVCHHVSGILSQQTDAGKFEESLYAPHPDQRRKISTFTCLPFADARF